MCVCVCVCARAHISVFSGLRRDTNCSLSIVSLVRYRLIRILFTFWVSNQEWLFYFTKIIIVTVPNFSSLQSGKMSWTNVFQVCFKSFSFKIFTKLKITKPIEGFFAKSSNLIKKFWMQKKLKNFGLKIFFKDIFLLKQLVVLTNLNYQWKQIHLPVDSCWITCLKKSLNCAKVYFSPKLF